MKKEENFRHYALSVPFYTHFTSPIRRYPDILVHRLLSAALEQEELDRWDQKVLKTYVLPFSLPFSLSLEMWSCGYWIFEQYHPSRTLDNCNSRKIAAKTLQEKHSELHLANLVRKSGSIDVKGIVISVLDRSVDVVLIYLGIIRRVYLDVSFQWPRVSVATFCVNDIVFFCIQRNCNCKRSSTRSTTVSANWR